MEPLFTLFRRLAFLSYAVCTTRMKARLLVAIFRLASSHAGAYERQQEFTLSVYAVGYLGVAIAVIPGPTGSASESAVGMPNECSS